LLFLLSIYPKPEVLRHLQFYFNFVYLKAHSYSTYNFANIQVVTESLQAAKVSTKAKEDGRPINFGVVVPGKIYRSSWPMIEDFQYLETLQLQTVM